MSYYYDDEYTRELQCRQASEAQRQREQRAYEQQRAVELGRKIGALESSLAIMQSYAENQVREAQNRARLEQWKKDQERISKPAVPAPNDPNNPKNWPKVGFNTDPKDSYVHSPGSNIRSR